MIEAKELRLGNLFIDRQDVICHVEEVSLNEKPNIVSKHGALTSLPVKPIQLTEDWLSRLGFYWSGFRNGWVIGVSESNEMVVDGRGNVYIGDDVDLGKAVSKVHQLQNLYFALTGKELTIETK